MVGILEVKWVKDTTLPAEALHTHFVFFSFLNFVLVYDAVDTPSGFLNLYDLVFSLPLTLCQWFFTLHRDLKYNERASPYRGSSITYDYARMLVFWRFQNISGFATLLESHVLIVQRSLSLVSPTDRVTLSQTYLDWFAKVV